MKSGFYDIRTNDGRRQFADLPQSVLWDAVRDHVSKLNDAKLTGFVCDYVTEAWIDFTYRGEKFSINDQLGEYWFFVKNPACGDEILSEVIAHFRLLLAPSAG